MKNTSLPPPKIGRPKKAEADKAKSKKHCLYNWEHKIINENGGATNILRDFAAQKLKTNP